MKEKRSKKLWKVYFWFMIVMYLLLVGFILFSDQKVFVEDNEFTNIYDLISFCIGLFSLIGVYGFIYEKKYFNKELWMFICIISIIEIISEVIILIPNYMFLFLIAFYILIIPFYYALYKYAFKMNYIWSSEDE